MKKMKPLLATKEGELSLGLVPNYIGKKVSDKYIEIETYMVDNSGFVAEDELALTPAQFLAKVKAGNYYALTGAGQFQVIVSEFVIA